MFDKCTLICMSSMTVLTTHESVYNYSFSSANLDITFPQFKTKCLLHRSANINRCCTTCQATVAATLQVVLISNTIFYNNKLHFLKKQNNRLNKK